jgi:alkylation response protein AidB-like acyl-CoA dehydrogenase
VAEQAVQLHGAMGVCEELPIAATFRALLAFAQRDGELAEQAARLGAWSLDSGAHAQSATLGA